MDIAYEGRRYSIAVTSDEDHIAQTIAERGTFYELDLLEYIRSIRTWMRGDTAVDVGANIGNHSLYFGEFIVNRVVLFEPNTALLDLIEANLRSSRATYRLVPMAVGAHSGSGTLIKGPEWNAGMGRAVVGGGDILFTTLDAELECDSVAFVKIDVEGGELDVLRGASSLLQEQRPNLFIECATPAALAEIRSFLAPFGYQPIVRWATTPVYHFAHEPTIGLRLFAKALRLAFKVRRFIRRWTNTF